MLLRAIDRFFRHDAAGGIVLMISTVAALVAANSALSPWYESFLTARLSITLDGGGLSKPLILWINDGLMAVFFLLVGLELKREMLEGKLKRPADIALPGAAAIAGMAVPAVLYLAFNWSDPVARGGWAIPAATDIAFALGVLALAGPRVPSSLKIFLLSLAILDDLGAILVIALFYTAELKTTYLLLALLPLGAMIALTLARSHRVGPILLLGVVLWVLVLKSGVHATLAGVITAFCIPMTDRWGKSPLHALEHALAPYVLWFVIPVFAFANAGVMLSGLSVSDLLAPLPLGIAVGLVAGKQIGVFATVWAMVRLGFARMPAGAGWLHVYGVACLAGIGFTMSLFIGSLSFSDPALMNAVRLGVLSGSALSAVLGLAALRLAGGAVQPDKRMSQPAPAQSAAATVGK
ncbi:MAG: Na+/H+ antiporter NhaA [Alphaproteobacteria bacterium]|nr:MAG: Na+/H+ antiporter NhaA [Alphaproteobacteria bacterium]